LATASSAHLSRLSDAELRLRIESGKERLGNRLVILGITINRCGDRFRDFTGDVSSFRGTRRRRRGSSTSSSAACTSWRNRRDILTDERVRVILPDLGAGCSMADMANLDQTLEAWVQLEETCPDQLMCRSRT